MSSSRFAQSFSIAVLVGTTTLADEASAPTLPYVAPSAGTCLPLVFQNITCDNGVPYANLDSCRILFSSITRTEEEDRKTLTELSMRFRRISQQRNLSEISAMLDNLTQQRETVVNDLVLANTMPADFLPSSQFMIEVLKYVQKDLESKPYLCQPIRQTPTLSFPDFE